MIKQIFFVLTASLVLLLQPSIASAEIKVGYVNLARIVQNAPQTKAAEKKLQAEFEPRQSKVAQLNEKVKKMKADLEKNGLTLSEKDLVKKQRDIRAEERELKLMVQDLNDDFSIRRNQELKTIQELVGKEAMSIAKTQSLDLLLSNGVVYASPKIDITEQILKNLSSK